MRGQDLTQGSIVRQIWSLAWPMMLSIFFFTLYNLVDAFWVAKISPAAIAAVSISQITLFVTIALSMGISVWTCHGLVPVCYLDYDDRKERRLCRRRKAKSSSEKRSTWF